MKYIYHLNNRSRPPDNIGTKATNLVQLHTKGFLIPNTYVCTWDAYCSFLQQDDSIFKILAGQLATILKSDKSYAVRSSANVEDSLEHSFAGQFTTVLDAHGVDEVLEAIRQIWVDTQSEAVKIYLQRTFGEERELHMAVVIQEMVSPVISGAAFSKNPVTSLDEIIVEAVEGRGTELVQKGVTPLRWVNKWGTWISQPDSSPADISIILRIVKLTKDISKTFKKDVDLEWVWDGEKLYWLQMRDITTLRNTRFYSNRISKEMLPGMIKPLVSSVNIRMNSGQWINLLNEITPLKGIDPEKLVRLFFYRAYFDMGTFGQILESIGMPRDSLEMMMGLVPQGQTTTHFKMTPTLLKNIPGFLRFIWDKWTLGNRIDKILSNFQISLEPFRNDENTTLDEVSRLSRINEIMKLQEGITYFSIVIPLLMMMYNAMVKKRLEAMGQDIRDFDLVGDLDALKLYDPGAQMALLSDLLNQLDQQTKEEIQNSTYAEFQELEFVGKYRQEVNEFLQRFGHLSDNNNDFSVPRWCEIPESIFKMITSYQKPIDTQEQKMRLDQLGLHGASKWIFNLFYIRARQFRLYREQVSSIYTVGLGLIRKNYLALGESFAIRGIISNKEDIFFLYQAEVSMIVENMGTNEDILGKISERKEEMAQTTHLSLPEIIIGENTPQFIPQTINSLKGIPTSRGYYTGKVKKVFGIIDFNNVESGDVLVIPYSDVGWTPLYAKAGAVLAESGGMLSHSSIIAREYNIPAVVSVNGVLQLPNGSLVSVDGFTGEVLVHEAAC